MESRVVALLLCILSTSAQEQCESKFVITENTCEPHCEKTSGCKVIRSFNPTTLAGCCAACVAEPTCKDYTLGGKTCHLRTASSPAQVGNCTTATMKEGPTPAPAPTPAPPPRPPAPTNAPNLVWMLTDDQDLLLDSMQAMPQTIRLLRDKGANMSNFQINIPICCPSRATILSGRYEHNNRVSGPNSKGCMLMNTSQDANPDWWQNSLPVHLYKLGYTTGMFGKMLNGMQTYGCGANNPKGSKVPNGWDRFHAFCGACYTNCKWNNQGKRVTDPEYSTSIIGNSSVEWLKSVAGKGRPFFAYLGPHAPHLPATPAPWYANHPVGLNTPPITPHYNYSAPDHHSLIANQPIINSADAAGIEHEYSDRLRSLLSVDDMVAAVVAALTEAGVLSNTYLFYSSDHGYSQGQFRVTSHKTQIYDHVTRVPMLITGPGIKAGTELAPLTAMVDIAPTMIDLAGGTVPPNMDGQSFKAFLLGGTDDQWRDQNVIEYHSIRDTPVMEAYSALTGKIEALTAQLYYEQLFTDDAENGTVTPNFHPHDGPNNTFRALRIINPARNLNLLYSEFTDVTLKKDWDFADGTINFFELYNCTTDPYQMHNLYKQIPASTQALLHDRVKRSFVCVGQTGCTFTPSSWPAIPPFGL